MVTSDYIDLTLIAKSYMLQLGTDVIEEQKKGCEDCADKLANQILQLMMLVEQIYDRIERDDLGIEAEKLYTCLLGAVAGYSGASLSLDPNAVNPNIDIIVEGGGNNLPSWIDVNWSDMTNDVDGYRDTYFNADWVGYNPMIQIGGVVMYQVGIDYDNDGNGTITFKEGKGLYEGSYFRAGNYQPYAIPTPPIGGYDLINNSSLDTTYEIGATSYPIESGETITSDFIVNSSITAIVFDGQQCTYTSYDKNGDIEFTTTQIGVGVINGQPMELGKNYVFIWLEEESHNTLTFILEDM